MVAQFQPADCAAHMVQVGRFELLFGVVHSVAAGRETKLPPFVNPPQPFGWTARATSFLHFTVANQTIRGVPRHSQKRSKAPGVSAGANPLDGLKLEGKSVAPLLSDDARGVWLWRGNSLEMLDALAARHSDGLFDMIFADPPYFLSNGGITCHAGRMVKVDKGDWDKSRGPELNHEFNTEWLRRCQRVLKPNGTIWVTGTNHVIYSVGFAMQQLGFKILNDIAWEKPNPPPNLSCRYFTHSTETVLWAAKGEKSKHHFNYALMRQIAGGKQMKSVWRFSAPKGDEKRFGKHPTQKPLALVERCILASTREGDLVLDPFLGAGTTAVAALQTRRRCVGLEVDENHLHVAAKRIAQAQSASLKPFPAPCPDETLPSPMAAR